MGDTQMSKATKTNAIAATVKTLSQAKSEVTKPSKVTYVVTEAHIALAREAGEAGYILVSAAEKFTKCAQALREAKVVIGDARNCPLAKAFLAGRFTSKVSASTKANALSAFRKAVSNGKEYSENAYREAKKTKAKKTGAKTADTKKATKDDSGTYVLSIAHKGSAKKAAQVLRDLMNKMKDAEEYSPLAALIIDALDEFDSAD
jgi:hypothetical protein